MKDVPQSLHGPGAHRLHLPHPASYRYAGVGLVEIVGPPQNPQGAERVLEVACVPLQEACRRFAAIDRPELAELYRVADRVRADLPSG